MARGGEKLLAAGISLVSGAIALKTAADLGSTLFSPEFHVKSSFPGVELLANPVFPHNILASAAEFAFVGLPAIGVSAIAATVADSTENNS